MVYAAMGLFRPTSPPRGVLRTKAEALRQRYPRRLSSEKKVVKPALADYETAPYREAVGSHNSLAEETFPGLVGLHCPEHGVQGGFWLPCTRLPR